MIQIALWIAVVLLVLVAILEIWYPKVINEGFSNLVSIGDSSFWQRWMPRRGDIGEFEEEEGYIQDPRYFHGYTDVQRLGQNHDYCRMIIPKGADNDYAFFACALGGTDGLSSTRYRTQSVREGLPMSRDDYMGKFDSGRVGYCRIVKTEPDTFECRCNVSADSKFSDKLITDVNPPDNIRLMMQFYQGIVFWLRFRDDMVDYAKNLEVMKANGLSIPESPANPEITEGLQFDGASQFIRIGDNKDLEFGDIVQLRYLRAMSFWVYFDEFTNNAHIIDFGNGSGKDNVWVGIVGRGNTGTQSEPIRPLLCGGDNVVPESPSGAQPAEVVTPEELMQTTAANVDEFECKKPEIFGRIVPPLQYGSLPKKKEVLAKTADLVYEVWDHSQRKMHLQVKNAIPIKKWTHVTITATTPDAQKPLIAIYINGEKALEESGWLPQTNYTTKNYIGKSNWQDVTSQYENADELFKGRLFDLRGYRLPMTEKKIKDTVKWGRDLLGLPALKEDSVLGKEESLK